jgi:hypothetical protein
MWAGLALAQDPDPEPATAKQSAPNAVKKSAAPAEPEFDAHKGRGKIFVKENTWDFGYVAQNTRVTHRFTVQNVGDDTLYITRLKPT